MKLAPRRWTGLLLVFVLVALQGCASHRAKPAQQEVTWPAAQHRAQAAQLAKEASCCEESPTPTAASSSPQAICAQFAGGPVWLRERADLERFAKAGCEEVGGDLTVYAIKGLRDLRALSTLERIGGDLVIRHNPALESLAGLEGLRRIERNLTIRDNPQLKDLRGLDNLEQVRRDVEVYGHARLESLRGLERLGSIGESLEVASNRQLKDVRALEGLERLGTLFMFHDNRALPDCALRSVLRDLDPVSVSLFGNRKGRCR